MLDTSSLVRLMPATTISVVKKVMDHHEVRTLGNTKRTPTATVITGRKKSL